MDVGSWSASRCSFVTKVTGWGQKIILDFFPKTRFLDLFPHLGNEEGEAEGIGYPCYVPSDHSPGDHSD